MKRQVKRQTLGRQALPRRRFLQALLGIFGGLGLPVWARRKHKSQPPEREADFYRVKEETNGS